MQFTRRYYFRQKMENVRESKMERLDLSGASTETLFEDDSLQDLSISAELEKMEASQNGAFDGAKISSKFEFEGNLGSTWLNEIKKDCKKRFERGIGMNMVNTDEIIMRPVS